MELAAAKIAKGWPDLHMTYVMADIELTVL
jgi:hypothetical protein